MSYQDVLQVGYSDTGLKEKLNLGPKADKYAAQHVL